MSANSSFYAIIMQNLKRILSFANAGERKFSCDEKKQTREICDENKVNSGVKNGEFISGAGRANI
mgnify:CR=1 FL=1